MNTYQKITAPNDKDLDLVLRIGNEGIMTSGVRVFEGVITGRQLANFFPIEASSDFYPEELKRQRDLEKSRAKKLIHYFDTRIDTVLPSLTIFVSHLSNEEIVYINNTAFLTAILPANADRLIADGQNRCNLYQSQTDPAILEQTVAVKFICTDSCSLEENTGAIRQLFSDYHSKLIKPKDALNLYYNSSEPYCELLRKFLDIEIKGSPLKTFVSTTGTLRCQQYILYNQLSSFITLFIKTSPLKINNGLKSNPEAESLYFDRISSMFKTLFEIFPVIDTSTDSLMFTKSIFLKATMLVARSILEESLDDGIQPDWNRLNRLSELPLTDMTDKFWIDAGSVKERDPESKSKNSHTMVSKSEQALARKLCRFLKIQPCEAI